MNAYLKNTIDIVSASSAVAIIFQAIPVVVGVLTIIWAWYRIRDIRLSIQIKEKQLKEN